jgi:hypothetical protein
VYPTRGIERAEQGRLNAHLDARIDAVDREL